MYTEINGNKIEVSFEKSNGMFRINFENAEHTISVKNLKKDTRLWCDNVKVLDFEHGCIYFRKGYWHIVIT